MNPTSGSNILKKNTLRNKKVHSVRSIFSWDDWKHDQQDTFLSSHFKIDIFL